ncbi:MAG: DNA alkylation repair protein [Lentisphaeria bacterium]|jgi:3-methyladenine DNA glycosylase AlkD|nr:DNA alkylation repair protein [Lentisphaeria bacterium]
MKNIAMLDAVRAALRECSSEADALVLRRFFKTGPGEYGEGDVFLGVRLPATRRIARQYEDLPLAETLELLQSAIHEERLLALLILVRNYRRGTAEDQAEIYRQYLSHTRCINNWDLVDSSAEHIVGAYLYDRSRRPLHRLAQSASLWDRRIAIMATFHFIKKDEYGETLRLAEMLVADREDLIHKAVGWMLREIGKRDQATAEAFLAAHCRHLPRTMLRYAIEKFPEPLRQQYLQGTVGNPGSGTG